LLKAAVLALLVTLQALRMLKAALLESSVALQTLNIVEGCGAGIIGYFAGIIGYFAGTKDTIITCTGLNQSRKNSG